MAESCLHAATFPENNDQASERSDVVDLGQLAPINIDSSATSHNNSSSSNDDLPLSMRASVQMPPDEVAYNGGTGLPDDPVAANGLDVKAESSLDVPIARNALQTSVVAHPSVTDRSTASGLKASKAFSAHRNDSKTHELHVSTKQNLYGASKPDHKGSSGKVLKKMLPKVKRSERCGYCHTCQNRQLKQACITVRAQQEAEARAEGMIPVLPSSNAAASAKAVPARKRPRPDEPPASPRSPFTSSLEAIIGSNSDGGLESVAKVPAMLHLMSSQSAVAQRKLLVEVLSLSSASVKSVLAGGRAVEILGTWLLEAATGGATGLAACILACLDALPIGISALRTAKIGKTVSKLRKVAAAELHAPAAALVDKWRTAIGTSSTSEPSTTSSRPSEGDPPTKRAKATNGKISMVNDEDMFRSVPPPQQRPAHTTWRAASNREFDPRAEAAVPGTAHTPSSLPRAHSDAVPSEHPSKQAKLGESTGEVAKDASSQDMVNAFSPKHVEADESGTSAADDGDESSHAAGAPTAPEVEAASAQQPGSPPSPEWTEAETKPLQPPPAAPTGGSTTRIGGLSSGLGSGIGGLMTTSAASRWGGGAAGRAAEAASRIPSPPPVARDTSRKRISWRSGTEIASIRFFRKDDAPTAVASDADLVTPEDNEAAAAAIISSQSSHPPAFESAARQEHLSEAAALRGQHISEKLDPSEVSEQQAFSQRYQAMAPTMPWISPPAVAPVPLWASGEESAEVSNEKARQAVVRPAVYRGREMHAREPPVHHPGVEAAAAAPVRIPLQPIAVEPAVADAAAQSQATTQPDAAVLPQAGTQQLQGVPYQPAPMSLQMPSQPQAQWQPAQPMQTMAPQQQWQQQQPPQQPYPQQQAKVEQPQPAGFVPEANRAGPPHQQGAPLPAGQHSQQPQQFTSQQHGVPGQPPTHHAAARPDTQQQQQQQWQQQQPQGLPQQHVPQGGAPPHVRPSLPHGVAGPHQPGPQHHHHHPHHNQRQQQQQAAFAPYSGGGRGRGGHFPGEHPDSAGPMGGPAGLGAPARPGPAGAAATGQPSGGMPGSITPGRPDFQGGLRPLYPGPPAGQPQMPVAPAPPQHGLGLQGGQQGPPGPPVMPALPGPPSAAGPGQQMPQQYASQEGNGRDGMRSYRSTVDDEGSSWHPGQDRRSSNDGAHASSVAHPYESEYPEHASRRDGDEGSRECEHVRSPSRGRGRGRGRGQWPGRHFSHRDDGDHHHEGSRFAPGRGRGRGGRGDLEGRGRGRGPGTNTGIDPVSKRRICLFFNQPGGCRKGNACTFAHVPTQIDEDQSAAEFARISSRRGSRDHR